MQQELLVGWKGSTFPASALDEMHWHTFHLCANNQPTAAERWVRAYLQLLGGTLQRHQGPHVVRIPGEGLVEDTFKHTLVQIVQAQSLRHCSAKR